MKYITFSRQFPKGHPKEGKPTGFVEKILYDLVNRKVCMKSKAVEMARCTGIDAHHPMYYIDTFNQYVCLLPKGHTIRAGSRFKPGETVSLRVWSGLPYRSKQIEFAQVEVKKVWDIEISEFWFINNNILERDQVERLAANDGLAHDDFINWFNIHPKKEGDVFKGQIICWSDINY